MSFETTKSNRRRKGTWLFDRVFCGKGIDIGAGRDLLNKDDFPNITSVEGFDKKQGNANLITRFRKPESYDFVYSSNCLEHMLDARRAWQEWWLLVKFGGYMIVSVPDEDLYEQGRFQTRSRWSKEHKHTFTIQKLKSWSRHTINMLELINDLCDCQTIKVELVDIGYDYSIAWGSEDQSRGTAEMFIEVVLRKVKGYGM